MAKQLPKQKAKIKETHWILQKKYFFISSEFLIINTTYKLIRST